jgi:hypothetical protein
VNAKLFFFALAASVVTTGCDTAPASLATDLPQAQVEVEARKMGLEELIQALEDAAPDWTPENLSEILGTEFVFTGDPVGQGNTYAAEKEQLVFDEGLVINEVRLQARGASHFIRRISLNVGNDASCFTPERINKTYHTEFSEDRYAGNYKTERSLWRGTIIFNMDTCLSGITLRAFERYSVVMRPDFRRNLNEIAKKYDITQGEVIEALLEHADTVPIARHLAAKKLCIVTTGCNTGPALLDTDLPLVQAESEVQKMGLEELIQAFEDAAPDWTIDSISKILGTEFVFKTTSTDYWNDYEATKEQFVFDEGLTVKKVKLSTLKPSNFIHSVELFIDNSTSCLTPERVEKNYLTDFSSKEHLFHGPGYYLNTKRPWWGGNIGFLTGRCVGIISLVVFDRHEVAIRPNFRQKLNDLAQKHDITQGEVIEVFLKHANIKALAEHFRTKRSTDSR